MARAPKVPSKSSKFGKPVSMPMADEGMEKEMPKKPMMPWMKGKMKGM